MSMINMRDLYTKEQEKENNKKEIYDNVLLKCHNKIKTSSKIHPYNHWCYFVIPNFIYGMPFHNKEECINYLFTNLTKNGFEITYTHPNLFIITWFKEDMKQVKNELKQIFPSSSGEHKPISDYKPSGNLIYNKNSLSALNDKHKSLFK